MSTREPASRWWVTGAKAEMAERDIVLEPAVGWRAWHVVEEHEGVTLVSWWLNTAWPARQRLESSCRQHGDRPELRHDCGIHAFKSREHALGYAGERVPYVGFPFVRPIEGRVGIAVGRVSLWGRVVAHRGGYRAQYAYPYDIFLLHGGPDVARGLQSRYAVDVADGLTS